MNINRQQLEAEYQKYISDIAHEYIKTHTVNQNLVKVVNNIQNKIRDLDILETVKNIKQQEQQKVQKTYQK